MSSVFKEFGVKWVPAFVACWGDKKLKKLEIDPKDVPEKGYPDQIVWYEKNKDEVNEMVNKLESK